MKQKRSKFKMERTEDQLKMEGVMFSLKKYIKNFRQNQYVGYDNPRYEYQLNRTKYERDLEYELKDYLIKENDERMVLSQNEHDVGSR